jgi:hypothetical protein
MSFFKTTLNLTTLCDSDNINTRREQETDKNNNKNNSLAIFLCYEQEMAGKCVYKSHLPHPI